MTNFCIHGVAAIVYRVADGVVYVLIQERQKGADSPETGLIEVPCAKVRVGESVFDALVDKVWLETGLRVTSIEGRNSYGHLSSNGYRVVNYIPFFSTQNTRENYPIVIDSYLCSADGEPLVESKDARNIRWVSTVELEELLHSGVDRFYPMIVFPLLRFIEISHAGMNF